MLLLTPDSQPDSKGWPPSRTQRPPGGLRTAASERLPGPASSSDRSQLLDLLRHLAASPDQVGDEPVVHVESTLILGSIPHVVTLRQHSPNLRAQTECVRQDLEDDVALRRPESVVPQRRQAERLSGAVPEIEP